MKFQRNCPKCNSLIFYKHKGSMSTADKKSSVCSNCCSELYGWNKINKETTAGIRKNGFFGKVHAKKTKLQLATLRKANEHKYKTDLFRKKLSNINKGINNPMHDKNFYDIWLNKYGKIEADQRLKEFKQNVSRPGELNGMFGKPSPQGSGNGWSGWYKEWFFRSLKELYFMINVIEKDGLKWECGEKKQYRIEWEHDGIKRTYHPDFIIGDRMIEIKPKSLWNSLTVKLKHDAAHNWCALHGMVYELIDTPSFDINDIKSLIDTGLLKFTSRYELKYIQLVLNAV